MTRDDWFSLFSPFGSTRDLAAVKAAISPEHLDAQDEWGCSALSLAVAMKWPEGVRVLLDAGADTELRYFRTGETALLSAVSERLQRVISLLLDAGANPDAANYLGRTPRAVAKTKLLDALFEDVPEKPAAFPEPRIQNAEHLAEHYGPRFQIPSRQERESLVAGQAVALRVYGPKTDTIKARIYERDDRSSAPTYRARLDPPDQETNLAPGTLEVTFGPEHVATVFIKRKP